MEQISISEFKAKCLTIVDRVNKTKKPVLITRRGKPVAEVIPAAPPKDNMDWIGSMRGKMEIVGDIVGPIIDLDDIEALND